MKNEFSAHPLQSAEWGEFRKRTGIKVVGIDGVQMTIHRIPHTPWTIGYIPKGISPTADIISDLKKIGKQEKCIFIQLEPNATVIENLDLQPAAHPLFTKYTFVLDLTKSEDELLKAMHPKTRYNIKVAIKHGVKIVEDTRKYHKIMWETLKNTKLEADKLNARLFSEI